MLNELLLVAERPPHDPTLILIAPEPSPMPRRTTCFLVGVLLLLVSIVPASRADDDFESLEVHPARATLSGPGASQRLVVLGVRPDGRKTDLTDRCELDIEGTTVRVDDQGRLRPVEDGPSVARVRFGRIQAEVPVDVQNAREPRRVSFRHEIVPMLTKLGCNQGACHGGQHGKGGFKLSLLGFEPAPDFTQIVKSAAGRRVSPSNPEESLLLLKPTLTVPHGGGKKMPPAGREYDLVRLWLEQGAPPPDDQEPSVVGLELLPSSRALEVDDVQHLVALATFSDGTVRDVTDDAKFDSLSEGIATVAPTGIARTVGRGETNILARYQGHAALARLTVPYGEPVPFEFAARNVLDEHVARRWRALGLAPSAPCTDAEFLRRAMLDSIGTTPSIDEIDAFLADTSPDKRSRLIDRLLDRPEYVDYWSLKWGDLLRVNTDTLGAQGMLAFNLWLRDAFRSNKPANRMAEELVTAQGSIYTNGPANYFRVARGPDDLAETTAQVFMGVRLQCAKCHHHPFEAYGQDDYYALAAYFARIATKNSDEFGLFGRELVVYTRDTGDVRQPRSGKVMAPRPLNAEPADHPIDRRRALAEWLIQPDNPWFARNIANRYWAYLLGKGIVNPIDDLRETNPPTNPELLDALAAAFVESGYDFKALLRLILNSGVYQLSSVPTPENRLDALYFTHYPAKRLTAEQLLDAVNLATGTIEKFRQRPAGTRAIALPDTNVPSYFLDTFGRPVRATACECERTADPTLGQALHLMNGDTINRKLTQSDGRLARMLKDPRLTDETLIQVLYRLTFARPATADEVKRAAAIIAAAPRRDQGAQDLLWGLLNAKEFLFNH